MIKYCSIPNNSNRDYQVEPFTFRPVEFGEIEKDKQEEMIPSDMLPPSESDSDSENEGALTISNPNRPLMHCNESDEGNSDEDDEFFEGEKESDSEQDEEHYVGKV